MTKKKLVPRIKNAEGNTKKVTLVFNFNDTEVTVKGDNVLDCILKLEWNGTAATPGLFRFSKGDKELPVNLPVQKMIKLFTLPTMRELLADLWERQLNES